MELDLRSSEINKRTLQFIIGDKEPKKQACYLTYIPRDVQFCVCISLSPLFPPILLTLPFHNHKYPMYVSSIHPAVPSRWNSRYRIWNRLSRYSPCSLSHTRGRTKRRKVLRFLLSKNTQRWSSPTLYIAKECGILYTINIYYLYNKIFKFLREHR